MQTIIDNILINYEILGKNNKNTVLILHGWKNSLKNWEEIGQNLSKKNRVVLLDLPGMGNSSLPEKKNFDTYDYAQIISKFINKLDLKKITLMGHSFGGKISTIVASNENSNIKKLILIDISGINNKNLTTSIKIIISKIFKNFIPKKYKYFFKSEDYKYAGSLENIFKSVVNQDITKEAQKIKIPTLIVWGENDNDVSLDCAKKLQKLIKNSHIRIVWKASHHPHIDKPEKFLEIIYEFI